MSDAGSAASGSQTSRRSKRRKKKKKGAKKKKTLEEDITSEPIQSPCVFKKKNLLYDQPNSIITEENSSGRH